MIQLDDHAESTSSSSDKFLHPMDNAVTTINTATTAKVMGKQHQPLSKQILSLTLISMLLLSNPTNTMILSTSHAYDTSASSNTDYASEVVQDVLQRLQKTYGTIEGTVQVYEDIVAIITEGKGIGGYINYKGVQLDRGYISDEDTTIYNPGLTLLTESEKQSIVSALVQSKNNNIQKNSWNVDTQAGFDYIREKLDPYHTYELRSYYQIVPYMIIGLYVGVLAIQQLAREWFAPAYIVSVGMLVLPAVAIIAIGPQ